ncbi:hypothetical protein INS49_013490 [Diaporthe citri]|uniref:uncharacterized protein n=1 Tax=Diaporthe citri TaxID=83186 RepID=UPI001C8219E8|nr:uncharacterized protein INS49_013490 [Diaporthe citri]KAG6357613.1 hypothetical protein INS49_013490 [Diaporthe citri]
MPGALSTGLDLPSLPNEAPLRLGPKHPMEEQSNDSSDDLPDYSTVAGALHPKKTLPPVSTKAYVYTWLVPLSTLISVAALVAWLASKKDQAFISLAGSEIGGHLTQAQAKGIDFVCSAFLAPLLFAGLTLLWFACARVCVVNEFAPSVPLQTLATVSAMSRGTYDPLQYYALLRGRTWKLAALGGIAFCSAMGSSALGNMIAYERVWQPHHREQPPPASYGFSNSEFTAAARSVSDVLYGLDFVPAILDNDSGYIGVNTTSASMTSLHKSVNSLSDVPGFRLSAECVPSTLNSVNAWPTVDKYARLSPNISYDTAASAGAVSRDFDWFTPSYSYFSGQEDGTTSISSKLAFPAWDYDCGDSGCAEKFYLIYMMTGIHRQSLHTEYGDLRPALQYKYDSDGYGKDFQLSPATSWGLECVLFQQQGLTNYTRSPDLQWSMAAASFDGNKTAISSQLSKWQQIKFDGEWAPPQLGVVLFGRDPLKPCLTRFEKCLPARNVSNPVGKYIYASGEITRIIHNIAAANASRGSGNPEYYHNVTGTVNRQYYRITYVPVLLLLALVSILLAALLTIALMISASKTVSWARFRQVDIVRLVIDAVGGTLRHQDEEQFAKLSGASDDEIISWAQGCRVAYIEVLENQKHEDDEFGQVQPVRVQLVQKAMP